MGRLLVVVVVVGEDTVVRAEVAVVVGFLGCLMSRQVIVA